MSRLNPKRRAALKAALAVRKVDDVTYLTPIYGVTRDGQRFAQTSTLNAFDYAGTLAPHSWAGQTHSKGSRPGKVGGLIGYDDIRHANPVARDEFGRERVVKRDLGRYTFADLNKGSQERAKTVTVRGRSVRPEQHDAHVVRFRVTQWERANAS